MANWYGTSRTNYFKVIDQQAFENALLDIDVEMHTKGDGLYCLIAGSDDNGNWPSAYIDNGDCKDIDIIEIVRSHLVEGECAVFVTAGAEKARYVTGYAIAVINGPEPNTTSINIDDIYAMARGTFGIEPTRAEY